MRATGLILRKNHEALHDKLYPPHHIHPFRGLLIFPLQSLARIGVTARFRKPLIAPLKSALNSHQLHLITFPRGPIDPITYPAPRLDCM